MGVRQYLHCSYSSVYRIVKSGQIRYTYVGKTVMFKPEYLDEYLDKNEYIVEIKNENIESKKKNVIIEGTEYPI